MAFLFQNHHGKKSKRDRSPPAPPKTPTPSEEIPRLITKSPATNRVVKRGREHDDTPRITVRTRSTSPPAPPPMLFPSVSAAAPEPSQADAARTRRREDAFRRRQEQEQRRREARPPVAAPSTTPLTDDEQNEMEFLICLSEAASLAKAVKPSSEAVTLIHELVRLSGIHFEPPTPSLPPAPVAQPPVSPSTNTPHAPTVHSAPGPEGPRRSYAATAKSLPTRPQPPRHSERPAKQPGTLKTPPSARAPKPRGRRPPRRLLVVSDLPALHFPDPTQRPHPLTILDAVNKPVVVESGDGIIGVSFTRGGQIALHTESPGAAARLLAKFSGNISRSLGKLFNVDPTRAELQLDAPWHKVVVHDVPIPPKGWASWPSHFGDDTTVQQLAQGVRDWEREVSQKVNKAGSRQGLKQFQALIKDRDHGVLFKALQSAQHGKNQTVSFVAAFSEESTANALLRNGISLTHGYDTHCSPAHAVTSRTSQRAASPSPDALDAQPSLIATPSSPSHTAEPTRPCEQREDRNADHVEPRSHSTSDVPVVFDSDRSQRGVEKKEAGYHDFSTGKRRPPPLFQKFFDRLPDKRITDWQF
ncbi:hypothetical protein BD626DRAFT_572728 [Schizophyllum amplum]|uniref:Uncharacterized protein n=1 Tax=Schizophyllum amplum TaxID=97359 RepID=A0A550C3V3_9AGAR|nr:hypothetical protein BD626DRAFT_572728 [Auriculariopsis ampla]